MPGLHRMIRRTRGLWCTASAGRKGEVHMKRVLFTSMVLALLLSACAPATPTTDPAQIQASAVAAANTMVALTQAAVPTETPVPPTALPSPTPLPSPTLLALPTLALTTLPTQQ